MLLHVGVPVVIRYVTIWCSSTVQRCNIEWYNISDFNFRFSVLHLQHRTVEITY